MEVCLHWGAPSKVVQHSKQRGMHRERAGYVKELQGASRMLIQSSYDLARRVVSKRMLPMLFESIRTVWSGVRSPHPGWHDSPLLAEAYPQHLRLSGKIYEPTESLQMGPQ
jgi:hypothetical protein